jgi:hypothetical protein
MRFLLSKSNRKLDSKFFNNSPAGATAAKFGNARKMVHEMSIFALSRAENHHLRYSAKTESKKKLLGKKTFARVFPRS